MTYEDFLNEWRNSDENIVCHSSGSTGTPKRIELPKLLMEESARRTVDFFNLSSESHLHSCISPDFIGGKMMAVRSELTGGRLSWETPSNRPLRDYADADIDLLAVVPSQMIDLIDRLGSLPKINAIIIGGSPIQTALRCRIEESGLNAWETYGMTETASHIALRRVKTEPEPFSALPGIKISTDPDERLRISLGKWGTFQTNDIANIDKEGRFHVLGRADNVIITGGKKVHPEQVEASIEAVLGCEVLVSGMPDDKWGEKVVLTLEKPIAKSPDEIMSVCHSVLSKECIPKEIIIAPIPRTSNGKKKRGGA